MNGDGFEDVSDMALPLRTLFLLDALMFKEARTHIPGSNNAAAATQIISAPTDETGTADLSNVSGEGGAGAGGAFCASTSCICGSELAILWIAKLALSYHNTSRYLCI